tara:strand:- start:140 stop:448 length:309 start_codon:yes stop_codon:yes gene_type:complete
MAKYIKFNDVASSANVASTFLYVEVDSIKYVDTASTSVVIYCTGRGADGGSDDTITITCAAGEETKIADRIIHVSNTLRNGQMMLVDVNFESGITDISPAVV